MKHCLFIWICLLALVSTNAQIKADFQKKPFFGTNKRPIELDTSLLLNLHGFKRADSVKILSNSLLVLNNATNKLIEIAVFEASSANKPYTTLIKGKSDSAFIDLPLINKLNAMKAKDTALIIAVSADGKTKDTVKVYKNVPSPKPKKLTTSLPGNTNCGLPATLQFISKEMIDESKNDFVFSIEKCFDSRLKRKLSGEFILLYDYRKGDYYPLKKIVRKREKVLSNTTIEECKTSEYVEFYRLKKSMFFSPPAGSQLKVELMNYDDTLPLNLEVSYRDNFLEEEGRFQSTLAAFQQGGTKKADSAKKKDTVDKQHSASASDYVELLIQLNQELCYYISNFNYNSQTSDQHQDNVQTIVQSIRTAFGLKPDVDIIEGVKSKIDGSDTDRILARFQTLFERLNNFQSVIYTAFRVKNRDNVILQFKDDKGRLRKEEELRISNGFKVDFSTGIFITGLKDETYVFKDTTVSFTPSGSTTSKDTSGKFIIRENSSRRKIGFGLLSHAYPRLSSNYNLGIATGISVNTEAEINLLAGLSLMLGSERRVVFSGGFIWGKANRLSKTVYEGINRKDPAIATSAPVFYTTPDNVVPVVNDWQRSWFLGVSYNFSSNR